MLPLATKDTAESGDLTAVEIPTPNPIMAIAKTRGVRIPVSVSFCVFRLPTSSV